MPSWPAVLALGCTLATADRGDEGGMTPAPAAPGAPARALGLGAFGVAGRLGVAERLGALGVAALGVAALGVWGGVVLRGLASALGLGALLEI